MKNKKGILIASILLILSISCMFYFQSKESKNIIGKETIEKQIKNNIKSDQSMVKIVDKGILINENTIGFVYKKDLENYSNGTIKNLTVINPLNTDEKLIVSDFDLVKVISIDTLTNEVYDVVNGLK